MNKEVENEKKKERNKKERIIKGERMVLWFVCVLKA